MGKIEIRFDHRESFLEAYSTHLRHLGYFIETTEQFSQGDKLEVELVLPPDGERFSTKCEVVYIAPNGIGVQFIERTAELTELLRRKVQALEGGDRGRFEKRELQNTRGDSLDDFKRRVRRGSFGLSKTESSLPGRRYDISRGQKTLSITSGKIGSKEDGNSRSIFRQREERARPSKKTQPYSAFEKFSIDTSRRDSGLSLRTGHPPSGDRTRFETSRRDSGLSPRTGHPPSGDSAPPISRESRHFFSPSDRDRSDTLGGTAPVDRSDTLGGTAFVTSNIFDKESLKLSSRETNSYGSLPSLENFPSYQSFDSFDSAPPFQHTPAIEGEVLSFGELISFFYQLTEGRNSGTLYIQYSGGELEVILFKGKVLKVTSIPPDERSFLGNILVKEKKISEIQLSSILERAKKKGVPLGREIRECGLLTKRELGLILRRQMEVRLGKLFDYSEFTVFFYSDRLPGGSSFAPPTSAPRLLFQYRYETLAQLTYRELEELLGDKYGLFVFPSPLADRYIEYLKLGEREEQFWKEMVSGRFNVRKLCQASNLQRRQTLALLSALHELHLIEFKEEMAREWREKEIIQELEGRLARLESANDFDILGVHWSATDREIETAYRNLVEKYSFTPGQFSPGVIQLANQFLEMVEAAYNRLKIRKNRVEFRSGSYDNISIENLVDLFIQQGDIATLRRDWDQAAEAYERALELKPDLSEVKTKLAKVKRALQLENASSSGKGDTYQTMEQKIRWTEEDLMRALKDDE